MKEDYQKALEVIALKDGQIEILKNALIEKQVLMNVGFGLPPNEVFKLLPKECAIAKRQLVKQIKEVDW
jgi:hypothetical protein